MDRQVQESIKKFEDKKGFVHVKLQTRQSFREDQEALERRISKYRQRDTGSERTVDIKKSINAEHVNGNGAGNSKLESIVMDIQKDHHEERTRTLSETADKEDSEINVPDDVVEMNESAQDTVFQNGVSGDTSGLDSNGVKTNGHASDISDIQSDTVKENGHAVLNGSVSLPPKSPTSNKTQASSNTSNTPPNVNAKGSVTPEPRLKLRGTRLYEKNSKLTASSSDHLDKISLRGGSKSTIYSHSANTHMRKASEPPQQQQVLVPVVAGADVRSLPADGNLKEFSVDEMVSVFRMLHLPEILIYRLATSKVDGKRFALFSDTELETLGMRNPVIRYFRDKSSSSTKRRFVKKVFML